jgi:hypothetical protein
MTFEWSPGSEIESEVEAIQVQSLPTKYDAKSITN